MAMSWPTFTVSPGFTAGTAGAPMCMDMGIVTAAGTGILTAAMSAVFFLCGTRTPCNLGLFTFPASQLPYWYCKNQYTMFPAGPQ